MKLIFKTTVAVLFVMISYSFSFPYLTIKTADRPDFTGKWKLNIQKSNFGKVPTKSVPEFIEIAQTKDSISMIQAGPTAAKQITPLNGKPVSLRQSKNRRTKTIYTTWLDNNKTMVQHVTFAYDTVQTKPHPLKAIDKLKLDTEGKTLLIERSVEVSDAKLNWQIIAVYDKQ